MRGGAANGTRRKVEGRTEMDGELIGEASHATKGEVCTVSRM